MSEMISQAINSPNPKMHCIRGKNTVFVCLCHCLGDNLSDSLVMLSF